MSEIWELSVIETVEQVRRGALSPVQIVQTLLGRIERLEPSIHAWQVVDPEGALAAARRLEERISSREPLGALAGVVVGIKDLYDVAGLPTTAGSPMLAGNVAERDCAAVARFRAADAVILGKTITTPFGYADPTDSRNPWNLEHTPGGSSTGSAAAVAARMVPGGLGSQTAGSGLRPAAYCGIVGIKPTYGRIPRYSTRPLSWSMGSHVTHARSVEDAALMVAAIQGSDPTDPASFIGEDPELLTARLDRPPRLGLVREMVDIAEPELRDHLDATARRFAAAGAQIEEVRLPYSNELMIALHHVIQQVEATLGHQPLLARRADEYPPKLRAYLEVGQFLPATAYVHVQRVRRRIFDAVDPLFGAFDALLLPTAPGPAPLLGSTGSYVMLAGWTMLGLPSAGLPSGLNAAGLPLGLQLISGYAADARLVATARWCEEVLGPLSAPPLGFG